MADFIAAISAISEAITKLVQIDALVLVGTLSLVRGAAPAKGWNGKRRS